MKKRLTRIAILVLVLLGFPLALLWVGCLQPFGACGAPSAAAVSPERLREHVVTLSEKYHPRSWYRPANLELCAAYIREQLQQAGGRTEFQDYAVEGVTCRNVRALFGPETGERLVVGAHYDAVSGTPGADDNASGVAGLIELARLLGQTTNLARTVELVAYTLEEPPFFRSEDMGSYQHAQLLKREGVAVKAMISLEMIGYFSDEAKSQHFPLAVMRLFYPAEGNFVCVVGNLGQRSFARRLRNAMQGTTDLPVYCMNAPWFVPGIDLSDHRNYWELGYPAVMVTDTAFYRNREYHSPRDTADRLDYDRMAKVVVAVYQALLALVRE
jgi:Zn-dependent M28 family amino/carboxypeptidase